MTKIQNLTKKLKTFNYFGKKNLELTNGLIQLIKTVKSKKI